MFEKIAEKKDNHRDDSESKLKRFVIEVFIAGILLGMGSKK